jgi:hypothetical protein
MSKDKTKPTSEVFISEKPTAEELDSKLTEWGKMPSDPMTSSLHGEKRHLEEKKDITNKSIRVYEYANGKGQLIIESGDTKDYENQIKEFKPSTIKTLQYMKNLLIDQHSIIKDKDIVQISKQRKFLVRFKISDYQKTRGIEYKEARKQIKRDIDLLQRTRLKYKGIIIERKKRRKAILKTSILDNSIVEIQNGDVIIFFDGDFVESLVKQGLYWVGLPVGYYYKARATPSQIVFKLCDHANTNQKRDKRRGFSIISVVTLLKAVNNIPSYEDVVKGKNRQVGERIIEPLINGLDELQNYNYLKWHFSNGKGKFLTSEQLSGLNRNGNSVEIKSKKDKYYLKWNNFKKLYIKYELNEPIETELIPEKPSVLLSNED